MLLASEAAGFGAVAFSAWLFKKTCNGVALFTFHLFLNTPGQKKSSRPKSSSFAGVGYRTCGFNRAAKGD